MLLEEGMQATQENSCPELSECENIHQEKPYNKRFLEDIDLTFPILKHLPLSF